MALIVFFCALVLSWVGRRLFQAAALVVVVVALMKLQHLGRRSVMGSERRTASARSGPSHGSFGTHIKSQGLCVYYTRYMHVQNLTLCRR